MDIITFLPEITSIDVGGIIQSAIYGGDGPFTITESAGAIEFTVENLTVTRRGGLVISPGEATVKLQKAIAQRNAYVTDGPNKLESLITVSGPLHISDSLVEGNKSATPTPIVVSNGEAVISDSLFLANEFKSTHSISCLQK